MSDKEFRANLTRIINEHKKRLQKLLLVQSGDLGYRKVRVKKHVVPTYTIRAHDRWIVVKTGGKKLHKRRVDPIIAQLHTTVH